MVGTGQSQVNPAKALFVTRLAALDAAIADSFTHANPDDAYHIDNLNSRLGLNSSLALYSWSSGTHTLEVQLWVDISAQGTAPGSRKWIKLGTPITLTGALAGEGAFHRVDELPSGLLAVQVVSATTSSTIELHEQHTT